MKENDNESLPAAVASPPPCEEKVKQCDGGMKFCKAMSSRLEDGHKKGINAATMMNFKTMENLPPLILYKTSASDNGLLMNYCPWCGRKLNRDILARHKRTRAQGASVDATPQAGKDRT